MAIFTASQLSFSGEEIGMMSELIMEETIGADKELSELHRIETGIVASKKIGLVGTLGRVGVAGEYCNPTADTNNAPVTEKTWLPKPVQFRAVECWEDWVNSFFVYTQNMGINRSDITGTDAADYITMLVTDAIKKAMWRISWFNDEDHANTDDSPAGVITSTTSLGYYTILDGFWSQIFSIVAADADRRYTISENANSTYATQALAAGKSYTILNKLYEDCDPRLIEEGGLMFVVTRSIFNNYATYLESQGVDASFTRIESGFSMLQYRGIPVVNMPVWDNIIRADFDDGTKWNYPHRAVLMTKDNMPVGLEETANHLELDVHYDRRTKEVITDAHWMMDAKIPQNYKIQAAY